MQYVCMFIYVVGAGIADPAVVYTTRHHYSRSGERRVFFLRGPVCGLAGAEQGAGSGAELTARPVGYGRY